MINARRIGIGVSVGVVVLAVAAAGFSIWVAGLKPGPYADLAPEYRALQIAARPAPDTPDAWPDLLAALVVIRETEFALFRDPEFHPAEPPDFSPLFKPGTSFDDMVDLRHIVDEVNFVDLFHEPEDVSAGAADESDDEFDDLDDLDAFDEDDDFEASMRASRERASRVVEALAASAHFDEIVVRLAGAEWALIEGCGPQDVIGVGGSCRGLSCLLVFRMRQAWLAGRFDVAEREMRAAYGVLRILYHQPSPMARLIGNACQAFLQGEIRRLLMTHPPDAAGVRRLELVWQDTSVTLPAWPRCLPAARLDALYLMMSCYSGEHRSRGTFLPVHAEEFEPTPLQRLGNLRGYAAPSRPEMTALIDALWNDVEALGEGATAASLRDLAAVHLGRLNDSAPAHADFGAIFNGFTFADLVSVLAVDKLEQYSVGPTIDAIGISAMFAIEHHRASRGHLPATLEALDLPWLGQPLPHINQPLAWRLIDPATDPHGRGYLLYLPGADGVDNRGAEPGGFRFPDTTLEGEDYVLNRLN